MTDEVQQVEISTPEPEAPQPLGSQVPTPEKPVEETDDKAQKPEKGEKEAKPEPKEKKSTREILKEASEKAKAKAAEDSKEKEPAKDAKAEKAKVDPKQEKTPSEVQSSAPKDVEAEAGKAEQPKASEAAGKSYDEPPSRFLPRAKEAWKDVHPDVKEEVHRSFQNLEKGIEEYKAKATEYEEIKEYSEMAKQSGTTIKAALDNYVGIEKLLRQDPVRGLEQIVSNLGLKGQNGQPVTLRDFAAHIVGQKPNEIASRQDQTIHSLRSEIESLKQQLTGVTSSMQEQEHQKILSIASDPAKYPRFEEHRESMVKLINSGMVADGSPDQVIKEAYELAERLNPAPSKPQAPVVPETQSEPLNPAGSKSIAGSPGSGKIESPRLKPGQPRPSIRESLKRASRQVA